MLLRTGRLAGSQFVDEHVAKVAPAIEVQRGSPGVDAGPRGRFRFKAVDGKALMDRYALVPYPVGVGVDPVARFCKIGQNRAP